MKPYLKPYFYWLTLPAVLLCLGANCSGTPEYPTTPAIAFINITPSIATTPTDTIVVTFGFTDGDGNLGFEAQSNINDVFYKIIRDNAPSVSSVARLPKITPIGNKKSIDGEISLTFSSFGLLPTAAGDSVRYEIMIMDRDSTLSNTIKTKKIWVKR